MGGMGDDPRNRLQPALAGLIGRHQYGGGGAVGDRRRGRGGEHAVLAERRAQGLDLGGVDPAPLLVGVDDHVYLAGLDRHRDDLVPYAAVVSGLLIAVGPLGRRGVDFLAAEVVLGTGRGAEYAHGIVVVGICQAVPGHVVEHFGAAVLDAGA